MKKLSKFGTRRYTKRELMYNKSSKSWLVIAQDVTGRFVAVKSIKDKKDAEAFLKAYRKPRKKKTESIPRGKQTHDYKSDSFQGNSF